MEGSARRWGWRWLHNFNGVMSVPQIVSVTVDSGSQLIIIVPAGDGLLHVYVCVTVDSSSQLIIMQCCGDEFTVV